MEEHNYSRVEKREESRGESWESVKNWEGGLTVQYSSASTSATKSPFLMEICPSFSAVWSAYAVISKYYPYMTAYMYSTNKTFTLKSPEQAVFWNLPYYILFHDLKKKGLSHPKHKSILFIQFKFCCSMNFFK